MPKDKINDKRPLHPVAELLGTKSSKQQVEIITELHRRATAPHIALTVLVDSATGNCQIGLVGVQPDDVFDMVRSILDLAGDTIRKQELALVQEQAKSGPLMHENGESTPEANANG